MDIAMLSMNMSQSRMMNEVGTAVMAMQMDAFEDLGANMIETMKSMPSLESMVNPAIGGNIDIAI